MKVSKLYPKTEENIVIFKPKFSNTIVNQAINEQYDLRKIYLEELNKFKAFNIPEDIQKMPFFSDPNWIFKAKLKELEHFTLFMMQESPKLTKKD